LKKKQDQSLRTKNIANEKIRAHLSEKGIITKRHEKIENLTSKGYGTLEGKRLVLNIYEALFLHTKKMIEVFKVRSRKPLDFQELLHWSNDNDENVWAKYLVYRDLRSRGYVVRDGFGLGIDFRVYDRGEYSNSTAAYLVLSLQEGQPILAHRIAKILKHVQSLKKKLVLAVINRRGEIVYYTLSKLIMR
jgi:tRNA-intron endonuclease